MLFQGRPDFLQPGLGGVAQRQAQGAHVPAQQVQRRFDGDGVHVAEHGVAEVLQLQLQLSGGGEVVPQAQLRQPVHLRWQDVGHYGDDALAAQHTDGRCLVIVAGPDGEVLRAQVPGLLNVGEVAPRLLDAVDVGVLGKLRIRLRRDGDAGAGGYVVQDQRHIHTVGDHLEVADEPGLAGLVVVGRHQQQSVGPGPLRVPGQGQGVLCGVGAGAGDHRQPPVHVVHTELDGPHPLPVAHGAGLAGGAADDDGVGAVFHLKVQQLPQGGEIHGLFGKGRDNGHTGPGEERLFQCTHAPFQLEMGN